MIAAVLAAAALMILPAVPSVDSVAPTALETGSPQATHGRLSDTELLELVQRQTFRYFWDFAHPVSGLARERSNVWPTYGPEVVTMGGSGFGAMAIVVATERHWITRRQAVDRLLRQTAFLMKADRFHGVFPHWLNGATGRTVAFRRWDDGGDVVETAYLFEGLLTARQYFDGADPSETELRRRIDTLWRAVDWTWHVAPDGRALMWNRSPAHGFAIGVAVQGWNEALIAYVLAAGSPTHAIDTTLYHRGWARDGAMRNGAEYEGIVLPLGPPEGGPLFLEHYSFLGLDPRGLGDRYADYWTQCVHHTRINYAYCVRNPNHYRGYGPDCWGLTSSDRPGGYGSHSPTRDTGVITPAAALSSFPYTPAESMRALRHFHDDLGRRIWGEYGFVDAFDETHGWTAPSYLAIDEGPIIGMIENHRTGLLWRLFMSCPETRTGLRRLGFTSPHLQ